MADPKRLVILQALTTHLEATVRTDRGAHWSLAGKVYRGRTLFGPSDPLPCLSLLESVRGDEATSPARGAIVTEDWPLLVQGWVPDDPDHPTDPAYRLAADVKQALAALIDPRREARDTYLLGGMILGLEFGPCVVRPPSDGISSQAFFYMKLTVKIKESLADPYHLD